MRHPDGRAAVGRLNALEQIIALVDLQLGRPELPVRGAGHLASQQMGDELHAVTDAEHRNACLQQLDADRRCLSIVDAGRAAGKNEAAWPLTENTGYGGIVRQDLRIDMCLADPAGNQLGVLRTEIEDENFLVKPTHLDWDRRATVQLQSGSSGLPW